MILVLWPGLTWLLHEPVERPFFFPSRVAAYPVRSAVMLRQHIASAPAPRNGKKQY